MTTGNGRRRARIRMLAGVGVGWGLALLLRPRAVVDRLCPDFPRSRLWVVRVLGARQVVQDAVVLLTPEVPVVRLASAVDLLHAASMVPLLRSPRYRRAALISGGIAALSAAALPAAAPRSTGRRIPDRR